MRLMELSLTTVLLTLTLNLLSGCSHYAGGTVNILDKEQCDDEGSLGAHCKMEFSGVTRDIEQPAWDDTRFGWFCMDPSDTVESKKEAEELCSIDGVTCSYPAQQKVQMLVHHHFKFMGEMYAHARASWRKKHGSAPLPEALRRSAGMGADLDPEYSSVAPRLDEAPAEVAPEEN